ncbi:MAG: NAD-dependent dehydratase, partial [Fimbriimonadaceae bacterium]
MRSKTVGILEWFQVGEYERVEQALQELDQLDVKHLRTTLSWADFHRPDGEDWYRWFIPRLAEQVEVLPCISYTPATLG